jgi:cytochrome c peroxidase
MAGDSRSKGEHSALRARAGMACVILGVGAAALYGLQGAPHVDAQAQAAREGGHGALAVSQQQKLLDKLALGLDEVPVGVDPQVWKALVPADNRITKERVALGRALYFDTRLSKDGTVACATCHDVSKGFTDRRPVSEGIGDQLGRRNAPTPLNALFLQTQFWDGRAPSLEEQAELPILNPIEMGQPSREATVAAIAGDAQYQQAFRAAYGREINYDDIARAIASFERTLVFLDAPFDRFVAGDPDAMSAEAKRGWALFLGKARCSACHQLNSANPLGTNNKFHNIGVSARHQDFESLALRALKELEQKGESDEIKDRLALETDLSELGRFVVTQNRADIGAFRTSQLRNVGVTAPYMHDGSLGTLWDVMDHYNKGGESNPYLDGGIEPLALTETEVSDVGAFMVALTDRRLAEQGQAEFDRQREIAGSKRPFRDDRRANRSMLTFETRLSPGK